MACLRHARCSRSLSADVTHRRRFCYLIRIAQGHLFEAIAALRAWEQGEPELRKLIQNLDTGWPGFGIAGAGT